MEKVYAFSCDAHGDLEELGGGLTVESQFVINHIYVPSSGASC